jgi:hypothetical protein
MSLPGKSKTITVEPLEIPQTPMPEREPAKAPEPAPTKVPEPEKVPA